MKAFTYCAPTEIVFGKDTQHKTAHCVQAHGGSRVLVVYGGASAKKSGLLDEIARSLTDAGLAYTEIGGVVPNPRLSLVREGIARGRDFGADFVLAVGGGSVIDTAKAVAHGLAAPDIDVWDFFAGRAVVEKSLPVGSVLTLSAAGSETSNSAVITNDEIDPPAKRGLTTPHNQPVFAIMNPALTYSLPAWQIAAGVTDIMLHTLERYFSPILGNYLSDEIAEGLLRNMVKFGPIALADSHDYDAMSEIMWSGSISHIDLTGLGGERGDWACHQLGHELSGIYDVTHGASLASVWGAWARYVCDANPARFAQLGAKVFQLTGGSVDELAHAAIDKMVDFFASLGMPTGLQALVGHTLREDELNLLADACSFGKTRTIGKFKKLDRTDIYAIYKNANA